MDQNWDILSIALVLLQAALVESLIEETNDLGMPTVKFYRHVALIDHNNINSLRNSKILIKSRQVF